MGKRKVHQGGITAKHVVLSAAPAFVSDRSSCHCLCSACPCGLESKEMLHSNSLEDKEAQMDAGAYERVSPSASSDANTVLCTFIQIYHVTHKRLIKMIRAPRFICEAHKNIQSQPEDTLTPIWMLPMQLTHTQGGKRSRW